MGCQNQNSTISAQAREQHVGAAFRGLRHDARPPALEGRPRHDAVLHGEKTQQSEVHQQRGAQRHIARRIDGLRHPQVADEADGIEERGEEHGVARDAVDKDGKRFMSKSSNVTDGAASRADACFAVFDVTKAYRRRRSRIPGERRDFTGIACKRTSPSETFVSSPRPRGSGRTAPRSDSRARRHWCWARCSSVPVRPFPSRSCSPTCGAAPSSVTMRWSPASRNCARRCATTRSNRCTSRRAIGSAIASRRRSMSRPAERPRCGGRTRRATRAAIAVLPFTDMSPARDQDYLCEGLAEELIDALTHVDGPARGGAHLFVPVSRRPRPARSGRASSTSVSCSKAACARPGDRLRITVQLIDVATGYHKWSEKFDRDAADVFAVQDEIAEKVATLLRGGELSTRERRAVRRQPTAIETYECFLRGRQRMHTMQQPHMDEARALYQRAIALDAEYAPAWAGLATLHALLYEWWGSKRRRPAPRPIAPAASPWNSRRISPTRTSRAATRCPTSADTRKRSSTSRRPRASIPTCSTRITTTAAPRSRPATSRNRSSCGARPAKCAVRISRVRCCRRSRCASWAAWTNRARVNREAVRRAERLLELNPDNGRVLSFGAGRVAGRRTGRARAGMGTRARSSSIPTT